ncbi:MAG: hypothetical protein Q4B62_10420 [Clostridiaceae bacterium]|nr:hypothetical protein [Clostridiaceae bacterium]
MAKKIIAMLLALTFVFAFAACGGKDDGTTTTPEETTADPFAEVDDTTAAPVDDTTAEVAVSDPTAAPVEGTTAAPVEGSTEAASEATTAPAAKKPESKEEIVAYFNSAVNGVKKNAKSITHHYSKISLNGTAKLPGWADNLLKLFGGADAFINDQLSSNSKGEQVYTGSDIKKFPVENETWASKLTAADVKEAKIIEKDGQYIIRIVTVADGKSSTVKHGQGHAPKAFNVILPGTVNDALGNIPGAKKLVGGDAEMEYPPSTATIYVDIATGRVMKAEYDLKWTINFGTEIVIPFTTVDSYTIKY